MQKVAMLRLKKNQFFIILAYVSVGLFIFFPGINENFKLSTPMHVGVDMSGYGITSEYLRTWKGNNQLENELKIAVDETDIQKAKLMNQKSLSFRTEVATEYILKALRWSYSAILASTTDFFNIDSSFRLNFWFAFLGLIALAGTVYQFVINFNISNKYKFLIPLLVILNSSYLNVLYQGQLAQVTGQPFFILILYFIYCLRNFSEQFGKHEKLMCKILISLLIAALMPLYNEMIFGTCVFIGLLFFLDFLLYKLLPKITTIKDYAFIFLLGAIFSFPVSYQWLSFLHKHLGNIHVGGWWQPRWFLPAEIMGILNPYNPFSMILSERTALVSFFSWFISFAILGLLAISLIRLYKKIDLSFALAPITFIIIVFLKTRYLEQIHNYQYMKAFTFFIPLLVITSALIFSKIKLDLNNHLKKTCIITISLSILTSGFTYIFYIKKESFVISESTFQSQDILKSLDDVAIFIEQNESSDFLWAGFTRFNWISRSEHLSLKNFLKIPIYVLVKKQKTICTEYLKRHPEKIVWNDKQFLIFKTDEYLENISNNKEKYILPQIKSLITAF